LLQVGITLTILPTNGVLHTVDVSDTLESIAEYYGVDPQAIIAYTDNHLANWPHRPIPGTKLMVPGGEKPLDIWSYQPNSVQGQVSAAGEFYQGAVPVLGTYSFIWPTSYTRITQYYWWAHRGLDIGAPTGAPVYASDSGTVVFSGWNTWGYGNLIVINHGNGFETYYAHLSSIYVGNGQYVYQGMQIGEVGNTGNSSGSHLHFEIRFGPNLHDPLTYLWQ
jgi:murein DD-endopeptidase MepM/ murein hydrolase activator NlpD